MPSRHPPTSVLRLRITLLESPRPVQRWILVPQTLTLEGLHRIVQLLMQWWDYHLYMFTIRDQHYGEPDPEYEIEVHEAASTSLASLRLKKGEVLEYEYDFGDDWRYEILVEGRKHGGRNWSIPWLIDGVGAGPPEDCGGVGGFEDLLEALGDPDHEEHDTLRTWVGEEYDPDAFDLRAHRHALLLTAAWGALGQLH